MSLFSFIRQGKDRLVETGARLWLQQTIQPYGKMTRLHIDSQNKRIDIELDLNGEDTPIRIDVKSYALTSDSGETFIELGEIGVSRQWMETLVANYLTPDKRRFKVPPAVKVLL